MKNKVFIGLILFIILLVQAEFNPIEKTPYRILRKALACKECHALTISDKGKVSTKKWANDPHQFWMFKKIEEKKFVIYNPLTHQSLRLPGSEGVYQIREVEDGYYRLDVGRNKVLSANYWGSVFIWTWRGDDTQKWRIEKLEEK